MPNSSSILVPGQTCWRIERTNRFALIVDAADYFRAAKAAMLKAKHSIMLIGWDFDTRIKLEPAGSTLAGPNRLGAFLSWLTKHQPGLRVSLLKWDLGMIQALGRGMTPLFVLNLISSRRLRLKLDGAHPVGAAHHQKIIVIDDAMAFCGGIDMTVDRWDTREHADSNALRTKPNHRQYGPWHDATTAVDGDAARAIGELARERWRLGTGERLMPAPHDLDPWPEQLTPMIEQVDVAIARTQPELQGIQPEIREIEALYLEAIDRAQRTIYLESQYLASRKIAEALALRLAAADGPEVLIVLPQTTEGWLESKTMGGARQRLVQLLRRADVHKRLGVFYPVTRAGQPIYVHAKIMMIDDELLRVGSSNLNNRSMGFDTECDLALEVASTRSNAEQLRSAISQLRRDLLCEHLGIAPEQFAAAMDRLSGSVLKTINALRGPGRTLEALSSSEVAEEESMLAENELLDPERPPPDLTQRISAGLSRILTRTGLQLTRP